MIRLLTAVKELRAFIWKHTGLLSSFFRVNLDRSTRSRLNANLCRGSGPHPSGSCPLGRERDSGL
jgi:hypothetical protein